MNSSQQFDAVVIGSGIGGLTCAALLAKHGLKTLVLEQHCQPGGFVTSWKRGPFRFDGIQAIGALRGDALLARIFSHVGVTKKVEFAEAEPFYRSFYPDVVVAWPCNLARFQQELVEKFPVERKNISRLFALIKQVQNELPCSYHSPGCLTRLAYPFRFPALFKLRNVSWMALLDRFFENERLKHALASVWPLLGVSAERASALYAMFGIITYLEGGTWFPKGGYQHLADSFAECLQDYGGILKLNSPVRRILIAGGRASGVELETGEQVSARHVISNADAKRTFLNLLPEGSLSSPFVRRVRNTEVSASGVEVRLGVRMALSEQMKCGVGIFCPDRDSVRTQFELAARNEIQTDPAKMTLWFGVPSLLDSSAAPPGCHIVVLGYMPAPYRYRDTWLKENRKQYEALKQSVADAMIRAGERFFPGLSSAIIAKDIATPLTYEHYTSASEGCWYDAACTPDQVGFGRQRIRTPIPSLYLTGAKTFPGHGIVGAASAGLFTADVILGGLLTKGRILLREELV